MFRVAPLAWVALVFTYLLLTQILALVPLIGAAAAATLVPAFTVGLMAAARASASGGPLALTLLFDGFRNGLRAQLVLGAIYLTCIMLVIGATALVDDGGGLRSMMAGKRTPAELNPGDVIWPIVVFGLAYAPVMMMFWFAPPLAAWHDVAPAKALFFSFFACLMNWRAFLAYGAATTFVMLALPFLVLSIVMLASGGAQRLQAGSLMIPLLLLLLPTLFASFYASYRDVFGPGE